MGEAPSLWRVELIHPLIVHFPLALLICGTLAWIVGSWVDQDGRWGFLKPAGRLALGAGAALAWVTVYTGDLADAQVVRTLCDPTVVEEHENLAYTTAAIFSAAIVADLAAVYFDLKGRIRTAITWLVGLALIGATALLGYVGHLGARLVFEQGAAVYQPSEDCREFE